MADKTVGMLENVPSLHDESLIPVEQSGELMHVTGKQFREFAEATVTPYSDAARANAILAEAARKDAQNAKTAAQSALSGVQNAIKNIPAGSTPIVNDLTTGGVTMALSAEMGKVLGWRPNHNFIDNWHLASPVNSRGQAEYASAGGTVDRWTNANTDTITRITTRGLTVTGSLTGAGILRQIVDNPSELLGKTVTISCLLSNGELHFVSRTIAAEPGTSTITVAIVYLDGNSEGRYMALLLTASGRLYFQFRIPSGQSATIAAAKLELGSIQTLVYKDADGNWVLSDTPNKGLERLKCVQSKADSSDGYTDKTVLHTGNKPSGSYTGNGAAASRVIDTGGIGNVIFIRGGALGGIITTNGGIAWDASSGNTKTFSASEAKFISGVITLATDSFYLNSSSITYYYQVL